MSKELAEMFVESTGTHFLDSGGAYGRAWQRHKEACKDSTPLDYCKSRPEAMFWSMAVKYKELMVSVDLFHFLEERLSYCEDLTKKFHEWADNQPEPRDGYKWTGDVRTWLEETSEEAEDFYEGNTYNDENCLSQNFQYLLWEDDGNKYIAVQIHGGCDARGGYTDARIFEMDRWGDNHPVYDMQRCGLYANPVNDDTAEGFSWYYDGHSFVGNDRDEPDLWELPWFDGEDFTDKFEDDEDYNKLDPSEVTRNEDGTLIECVLIFRSKNRAFYSNGEGVLYELFPGID